MTRTPRLVCVSNRLPISGLTEIPEESGNLTFLPSAGGLVTALNPVLRRTHGVWMGWPGPSDHPPEVVTDALKEFSKQSGFELAPVYLDPEEVDLFYRGFSNSIIWPLFHDLQSRCDFDAEFWRSFLRVEEQFALALEPVLRPDDLIWVHDYHLMGLGKRLKLKDVSNPIAFFLHIPFPAPDIFLKFPWRDELMRSLLYFDLIGFQTERDMRNFSASLQALEPVGISSRAGRQVIRSEIGITKTGAFPISIDFPEFNELARLPEVRERADEIKQDMNVEFLVLAVDRLDYTKGIPNRVKAFGRLFERAPELKHRVALLQVVVPSREEVPGYAELRAEIEQAVSQVNGELSDPGWVPVQHIFRSVTREELVAMYSAADVAMVTPLKDGMNLVAKEFCAAHFDERGVLILSEFAGAAEQLGEYALMVNPYDEEGMANALMRAFTLERAEVAARMRGLREVIRNKDVIDWARGFLKQAGWKVPWLEEEAESSTIWARLRQMAAALDM